MPELPRRVPRLPQGVHELGSALAPLLDGQPVLREDKLILRDDYAWNGIAWAFSFDTSKELQTIEAPFSSFVPTLFARSVPGKKLDTRAINTLQLTLSKFEYDGALNPAFTEGAFRLELESIEAF